MDAAEKLITIEWDSGSGFALDRQKEILSGKMRYAERSGQVGKTAKGGNAFTGWFGKQSPENTSNGAILCAQLPGCLPLYVCCNSLRIDGNSDRLMPGSGGRKPISRNKIPINQSHI